MKIQFTGNFIESINFIEDFIQRVFTEEEIKWFKRSYEWHKKYKDTNPALLHYDGRLFSFAVINGDVISLIPLQTK